MTWTILSATWGNAERTSAEILTDETGYVAISEGDTPEEWKAFLQWAADNGVQELPPAQPLSAAVRLDRLLASHGLTKDELKALLGVE